MSSLLDPEREVIAPNKSPHRFGTRPGGPNAPARIKDPDTGEVRETPAAAWDRMVARAKEDEADRKAIEKEAAARVRQEEHDRVHEARVEAEARRLRGGGS